MVQQIKLPMQMVVNASLDLIRTKGDVTDAVVILLNQRTGEAKIATMRGDANAAETILQKVLHAIQKDRLNKIGLIKI